MAGRAKRKSRKAQASQTAQAPQKPQKPHEPPNARSPGAENAKPSTREEMKQHSRDALVRAALELFAEQGIDAPSLDAICERAGYTRGVFYVHFEDREALLVAVMDRVGEAFLESVFRGLAGEAPSPTGYRRGRFRDAAARFIASVGRGDYPLMSSAAETGPLVRMHQLLAACARSPLVRTRYGALVGTSIQLVADLVAADQRDGMVRDDVEASAVASIAVALIVGAQTLRELDLPLDPRVLAATVERLLTIPSARASR